MFRTTIHWLRRLANPPVFVIAFARSAAQLTTGRAPAQWVVDCSDIAADFGITRGTVEGIRTHRGLALRFSPAIPAASHQRFRNVFAVHQLGKG